MVNLSDHTITESQTSVLNKGLNFCPTPREPDMGEISSDFDKFFRILKLKNFFHKKSMETSPQTPQSRDSETNTSNDNDSNEVDTDTHTPCTYKFPSSFTPTEAELADPNLEAFCRSVKLDLAKFQPRIPKRDRLREHFRYILQKTDQQPLGRHFAQLDHDGLEIQVHILEYIQTPPRLERSKQLREEREKHWIHQLRSIEPFGLNIMGK